MQYLKAVWSFSFGYKLPLWYMIVGFTLARWLDTQWHYTSNGVASFVIWALFLGLALFRANDYLKAQQSPSSAS